jgi:hypothetical protein
MCQRMLGNSCIHASTIPHMCAAAALLLSGRISPLKRPKPGDLPADLDPAAAPGALPADLDLDAALEEELSAVGVGDAALPSDAVTGTPGAGPGTEGGGEGGLVSRLPSHISAFGEGSMGGLADNLEGLALMQEGGSDDAADAVDVPPPCVGEAGPTPGRGAGFLTQDSGFSLAGLQGGREGAGRGSDSDRRSPTPDSSLQSLPESRSSLPLYKADLTVLRKIGEGAFGEVALASTPSYGLVAVKWLKVGGEGERKD